MISNLPIGLTGSKGEKILEEIGVACNKNTGIWLKGLSFFLLLIIIFIFNSVPGDKSAMVKTNVLLL